MNYWLGNYMKLVTLAVKALARVELRYVQFKLYTGSGSVVSFTLFAPYPRKKEQPTRCDVSQFIYLCKTLYTLYC